MTSRALTPILTLLSVFIAPVTAPAQCGGSGDAILEIRATCNAVVRSGSKFTIRMAGPASTHACLICDTGPGPKTIPGIGTFCLDMSGRMIVIPMMIGSAGIIEGPAILPSTLRGLICCQWVGITPKREMPISNAVCAKLAFSCKGGLEKISLISSVPAPTSATVKVIAEAKDKDGKTVGRTSFDYKPASPPKFPVTSDRIVYVDKVSMAGGKLWVVFRVDATRAKDGKLPSNTRFELGVGTKSSSTLIHTSCSKPIGAGMVFGPFTITSLEPKKKS